MCRACEKGRGEGRGRGGGFPDREGDPAGEEPGGCHVCPRGTPAGGREQLQRRLWDGLGNLREGNGLRNVPRRICSTNSFRIRLPLSSLDLTPERARPQPLITGSDRPRPLGGCREARAPRA